VRRRRVVGALEPVARHHVESQGGLGVDRVGELDVVDIGAGEADLGRTERGRVEKVARGRPCRLGPRRLEEETAWIEGYRQLWASRFDELDKVVEELKRKEKVDGRKKRE